MSYGHNKTTKSKKSWNVKESKLRPEINSRERVDLNPESFDRLIAQKGVMAKIYRTTYCPKVKSVDGAEHEIDCSICNGSGFIDLDPICVSVYIQTQELDKLPQVEGFVDGNTVLITFPIGVEMQYFTRIELEDFTQVFMQRVMRAPGTLVDVLKYRASRMNVVVDYDNVRYYQDQDFSIDINGNIRWLTPGDKQKVAFSAVPDAGTWALHYGGHDANLSSSSNAAAVQTALRAISGLENVLVTGNYTTGFVVTFVGVDSPVTLMTSTSALTASSVPVTINVTDASLAAKKPNDSKPYSVHYECAIQFRAYAAGHVNRFSQSGQYGQGQIEHLKFPEQWYCKKEFLVKRVDFDGNETEQGPFSTHTITVEDGGTEAN